LNEASKKQKRESKMFTKMLSTAMKMKKLKKDMDAKKKKIRGKALNKAFTVAGMREANKNRLTSLIND